MGQETKVQFRISISLLLAWTALIAAVVHLWFLDHDREPYWRKQTLVYQAPAVPYTYNSIVPIQGHLTNGLDTQTNEVGGEELYSLHFKTGWEEIRLKFYRQLEWRADEDHFDFFEEYDLSKVGFYPSWSQANYAEYRGREKCRNQIRGLLNRYPEKTLRRRIAASPKWQYVPGSILFTISMVWLGALFLRPQNPD